MKWQKIAIITFVLLMLVAPASAFLGNSSNYEIRGIFGGSGLEENSTNYQVGQVITNQQPTWRVTTIYEFFVSGIYPFGLSCLQPTNNSHYIIGTDIMDQDILICPGTYSNVTFAISQSNTSIDCSGSTFIGANTGTGFLINFGQSETIIHDCNIHNYTNAIQNIGNSGTFYTNNLSFNSYGARNTPTTINNLWYNNYFANNSIQNAQDLAFTPANFWNTTKDCLSGFNIIGGLCIGGNYFDDYNGTDNNYDGIGDTEAPYQILTTGNDYLPLTDQNELPDAGMLAISFIIGLFSIAFILAYLSTTIGISKIAPQRFLPISNTMGSAGGIGQGIDLIDKPGYTHWPLRMYFLMLCMLTIVADLHIIATLERDYIASLGTLTYALVDKLPYAILLVPIFYLMVTLIYGTLNHMKKQKEQQGRYD